MPFCCNAHCYTRHHQCPMPPCYKAHCCKASSVPYASLLQGPLQGLISALCLPVERLTAASSPPSLLSLRALCYYSLYTALCWSVFYTRDGLVWSVFYTPTVWSGLVWSGLCFIPNLDHGSTGCSRDTGHARAYRGTARVQRADFMQTSQNLQDCLNPLYAKLSKIINFKGAGGPMFKTCQCAPYIAVMTISEFEPHSRFHS